MTVQSVLFVTGSLLVGLTLVVLGVVLLQTPALMQHRVPRDTYVGLTLLLPTTFFLGAGLVLMAPFDVRLAAAGLASLLLGSAFGAIALGRITKG